VNEHDLANEVLAPLMADLLGRHVNTVRATYGPASTASSVPPSSPTRPKSSCGVPELVWRTFRVGSPLAARTELTAQMLIFGEQSWRNTSRPTLFFRDELHEWGDVGDRRAGAATVIGKSTKKPRTRRGPG
jgi:hypothetical protein